MPEPRFDRARRFRAAAATLAVATLCAAAPARAGNPLVGMPDLDQKRTGLLTNAKGVPGAMFCVPTATMNALYFLQNHGFGGLVQPFNGNYYESRATYNISLLGMFMGTTGPGGTTSGMVPGLRSYLETYTPDLYVVVDYWVDSLGVNLSMLQAWLDFQGLVLLNWGSFDDLGGGFYTRTGGHETTLTAVSGSKLFHTDPNTDESPSDFDAQSPFTTGSVGVVPIFGIFGNNAGFMLHSTTPGSKSAVDGFTVIRPMIVFHDYDTVPFKLSVFAPKNDLLGAPLDYDVPLSYGKGALDLALHPVAPTGVYIMNGSNAIWQADLTTGRSTQLATLRAPRRLAYGGKARRLYVLDGSSIVALDESGRTVASAASRVAYDAIAYDPIGDRMVAYSRAAGLVAYYGTDLAYRGAEALPALDGSGRVALSIDGRSGTLWLHADGSRVVLAATHDLSTGALSARRVVLQTSGAPRGLFVDDAGYLFTSEDGALHEYTLAGAASRRTQLAGAPSGGIFTLPRSYSNYDERTYGPRETDPDLWGATP